MVIIYIIILILLLPWLYGFFQANDFSVSDISIKKFKNILVIFPHPDDETLSAGGLIANFIDQKSSVTVVVLTRGEKGNDDAHTDETLKEIRKNELLTALNCLGVTRISLEDFGDGQLRSRKNELSEYIDTTIQTVMPDLIITYDLSGLYGHDDHIIVSEIISDRVMTKYKHIALWYPSFPKKILAMLTLPEHMAKNPEFKLKRVTPNAKVLIGKNITRRIRALYAYGSQLYSFRKSFPVPQIPLWYYYSMQLFEYYHEANPRNETPA